MKRVIVTCLALGVALLPSCANYGDLSRVTAGEVGTVSQVIPGTIVSARTVRADASGTDKALGTGVGAALGAGAGSLLGGGSGRVVSTVGFGVLGALAGRGAAKYANQSDAQELVIRADGTNATYSVVQPIYEQYGPLSPGLHGNLHYGSKGSKFIPDGY